MITKKQRYIIGKHPAVVKVHMTRDPKRHVPELDARVWTDGLHDMRDFLDLVGLAVVDKYHDQPTLHPTVWHVVQAPPLSLVLSRISFWTMVQREILDLDLDADDLPPEGAMVCSQSGNEYRARYVGPELVLLAADAIRFDLWRSEARQRSLDCYQALETAWDMEQEEIEQAESLEPCQVLLTVGQEDHIAFEGTLRACRAFVVEHYTRDPELASPDNIKIVKLNEAFIENPPDLLEQAESAWGDTDTWEGWE